jgi:hypothetical protein
LCETSRSTSSVALTGTVVLSLPNNSDYSRITLRDVLYAPDLTATLISVHRLDRYGYRAEFSDGNCTIFAPDGHTVAILHSTSGLYCTSSIIPTACTSQPLALQTQRLSMTEAHRALGHINHRSIRDAIRLGHITGIELDDSIDTTFCEACAQAKPHCLPFPTAATRRSSVFGERIHTDLWGPASVESLGRKLYCVDFIDDATRWTDCAFLARKDEVFQAYKTSRLVSAPSTRFASRRFDPIEGESSIVLTSTLISDQRERFEN